MALFTDVIFPRSPWIPAGGVGDSDSVAVGDADPMGVELWPHAPSDTPRAMAIADIEVLVAAEFFIDASSR
ncbi:hypothetical protein AF335_29175 [Streptomyces eurocidicus]|uniref:Uncharacterized protein n=1 Tax=Streptomyces eurocidicus TaxID=66423 RepID=A0A2N8NNK7_STREU|nr:hypothetical protein [Streptomyces eurocidicus]PNE30348.1 hypothetical protein AF335_29175 [Streptomyces eurocidicus]